MFTIYLIAYNEAIMLPHTIKHYRTRFPGCRIVVYDNFSTDLTREIAEGAGCEIMHFYTNDKLSDQAFIEVKNNCWKDATTDWVIVSDVDELLDIWPENVIGINATILQTFYIDMIGIDTPDPTKMRYGVISPVDGKFLCFNRTKIKEMNYQYGCHEALPIGEIIFSARRYRVYHYKWLSLDYVIHRHREFGRRLSAHNIRHKLGFHYRFSKRKIVQQYKMACRKAVKVK